MSRSEQVALLDRDGDVPVSVQADLLGLSRSSLSDHPVPPAPEEIALKQRIDEIYTECPFYDSCRFTAQLNREGILVNRKAVQQHMREMGIVGIAPKPNLSTANPEHVIHPYRLGEVNASCPNHVWGIDITYIRLTKDWMDLGAVLDWFSRYVVSWELDQTLVIDFVLDTADWVPAQAKPVIGNSDHGSHRTSPTYLERLLVHDVQIRVDDTSCALDNIFTERLWRTVKYQEVYLTEYASPRAASRRLGCLPGRRQPAAFAPSARLSNTGGGVLRHACRRHRQRNELKSVNWIQRDSRKEGDRSTLKLLLPVLWRGVLWAGQDR